MVAIPSGYRSLGCHVAGKGAVCNPHAEPSSHGFFLTDAGFISTCRTRSESGRASGDTTRSMSTYNLSVVDDGV
jgi:hypothetical protein